MNKELLLTILREYQREFVLSDSKITIGNFSRRTGKSTVQMIKVLYEMPHHCYYVCNCNFRATISRELKEVHDLLRAKSIDYIKRFTINDDLALIEYMDGSFTKIYNYIRRDVSFRGYVIPDVVDIVIYNECLPILDIQGKKYISTVTMRGLHQGMYPFQDIKIVNCGLDRIAEYSIMGKKEIDKIRMICSDKVFINEIDINDEYESIYGDFETKKSLDKFIDEQIEATIKEFEGIHKNMNTLNYRSHLLAEIRDLTRMRAK